MSASETLRSAQDAAAWDLFVFRKARVSLCSENLRTELLATCRLALARSDQDGLLNALIRAGELECGLADSGSPELQRVMHAVDELAALTVQPGSSGPNAGVESELQKLPLPATVVLSHPEGFSYYGLHPLDFWDLAQRVRLERPSAAVIGIRSIGTTLSSIVCRAVRCRGLQAERITVRPQGPPYQRHLKFTPGQLQWIGEHRQRGSEFLVVDEGPGFSGSSFTAVGRALRQAGVPILSILFMGSRNPESAELQSRFDPGWSSFRFCSAVQGTRIPAAAKVFCAGGYWRQRCYQRSQDWPACWTQLERNKYLSADGKSLFKFEGFGRYGETVCQRAQQLSANGFAPPVLGCYNGYLEYATVPGHPMSAADRNASVLQRLADYCAFRAAALPAAAPGPVSLESMLAHNLQVEFGLQFSDLELPLKKLVVADSRMMPHEWIAPGGQMIKTDGASHGDDHLFPGPTDIAWDLAGVIVEWELGEQEQDFFLSEYRRRSGDNATARVPAYVLAYSVFRMAYCRMGAAAMGDWDDFYRLQREYRRHRNRAARLLGLDVEEHGAGLLAARPTQQAA